MFRLLKYAILFFIGYRILKMLFGETVKSTAPANNSRVGGMRINPANSRKNDPAPSTQEGEYIDFEEVK